MKLLARSSLTALGASLCWALAPSCGGDGGGSGGGGGGGGEECQAFDDGVQNALEAWTETPENQGEVTTIDTATCESAAPSGATCTFAGQVIDFEEDEWLANGILAGTTVIVFPSNQVDDISIVADPQGNCAAHDSGAANPTCWWATADDSGHVDFPSIACDTRFAVWANKIATVAPPTKAAIEFDRVVEEGSGVRTNIVTISQKTYNLVPGIVGFNVNAALGIVAGQLKDCSGNGIRYASAHVATGHLTSPPETFCGTDPIHGIGTFYFVDNFPSDGQTVTSEDGLWAFANVPTGDVTVFAFTNEGGTLAEVGRTELVSLPDTITIADILYQDPS